MVHCFYIDIAVEYGVLESILLYNIAFWVHKNFANEKNFFDGYYWTYNSSSAFSKMFPYATKRQIEIALKNLRENGLIKTGNYNENKYDRTLWYTLTEKSISLLQFSDMEDSKKRNAYQGIVTPIPDTKTDFKTDSYPYNPPEGETEQQKEYKPRDRSESEYCKMVANSYNTICSNLTKVQKVTEKRKRAIKKAKKDIEEFGGWDKFFSCVASSRFLNGQNKDGWKADFDWLLKPEKMVKIMEGSYQNNAAKAKSNIPDKSDYDEGIFFEGVK